MTTWRPDTCGCTVTYETDADGTMRLVRNALCPAHISVPAAKCLDVLLAENREKNMARQAVLASVGGDPGPEFQWVFEDSPTGGPRTLRCALRGRTLTASESARAQAALDLAVGHPRARLVLVI